MSEFPFMITDGVYLEYFPIYITSILQHNDIKEDIILYGRLPEQLVVGLNMANIVLNNDGWLNSKPSAEKISEFQKEIDEGTSPIFALAYVIMLAEKERGAVVKLIKKEEVEDEMYLEIQFVF